VTLQQLVERAGHGDLAAFGKLVERFQDAVYGTACAILGDFHDAQDVAQNAFVKAWRKLRNLRDPVKFPGWLYQITRNCSKDFLRRAGPENVPLETGDVSSAVTDSQNPDERLEKNETREAVLAAIRALSEPNRLATTLFYIDGYTIEEVSQFLTVPKGTVKRRLHDSRNRLRERMMAMVEDELKGSRPGPEFRERIMRKVSRVEVRPEKSSADVGRVVLVDESDRCLTVLIGKTEEAAIHRALTGNAPPRPLTHELLMSVLKAFGVSIREARIADLTGSTFIGELVLERSGEERVVDCRPSDAIALAMVTNARVTVAEEVMQRGGAEEVHSQEELEQLWDRPANWDLAHFNDALVGLCVRLQNLSDQQLRQLTNQVGPPALAYSLVGIAEVEQETEHGWKRRVTGLMPAVPADARAKLPDAVAQAAGALLRRLGDADVSLDVDCLSSPLEVL